MNENEALALLSRRRGNRSPVDKVQTELIMCTSSSECMSRRVVLRGTALALGAVTTGAVATGVMATRAMAQQKISQANAKYQPQPKGQQRCDNCVNFQAPKACKFVQGDISPSGWCQLWAAKT